MKIDGFFAELKRRNVYKVAVAYAVVGWLLIQIATQVFPFLEIPNWVVRLVIALVVIAFPIALMIAWAFEATPEGIRRTELADAMPGARAPTKNRWIYVVGIGTAVSLALFFLGRYTADSKTAAASPNDAPAKSIAVLPFETLSEEKANAYFAEGVQDEILTKLATVRDLKVISRTSTAKYRSTPDNLKTVGQELGVSTLLEGAVQKAGDKVRVNVQLINARNDSHLWAKSYDRDFRDVLKVESEIAEEIAESLKAKLSSAETMAVASAPTANPEAHDLFLRAEYSEHQAQTALNAELFDRADDLYHLAVARDSKFALAYARLAYARLYRHWFLAPLNAEELREVKSLIYTALTLAPDLAEAHLALGVYHYWGFRHYEAALEELGRTAELQPNNADARQFSAWIHRRLGQWERSLAEAKRAQELNPRDASIPQNIGATYNVLRQWTDAEREVGRARELDPYDAVAANILNGTYIGGHGDIRRARQVYSGLPFDLKRDSNTDWGCIDTLVNRRVYLDVLSRHFTEALQAWDKPATETREGRLRQLEARAAIQVLAGQTAPAQGDCAEACPLLEAKLAKQPEDPHTISALAWVYVCLGRNSDALRVAQRGVEVVPIEKDALAGVFQAGQAQVQARTGHSDEAINTLRQLLAIPAGHAVSIARLKLDPVWDPIRQHPGFQQLLAGPEQIGPNK